ncbi:zinc finger family protein [Tripterygium wilfordii]|uniref:Zinc finger family protein n=1 Tax=Tripterygium wilfordii TaxID=458696 RepID=A0A7J7DJR8_TRIWF|nr:probable E3 ubiquitin-protein ligase XERICO [Tripterygium wilfordii]KAF5746553.1 zinc finger family protein [Tripterygium wilfordii]
MGLSNFPIIAEGLLPVLVMNTVLSLTLLKNILRTLLHLVGAANRENYPEFQEDPDECLPENGSRRRVSITQFKSLCQGNGNGSSRSRECCVCLCGFEAEEEVSELSCKHFFHKGCLEKWFDNKHTTCPLCRSIL